MYGEKRVFMHAVFIMNLLGIISEWELKNYLLDIRSVFVLFKLHWITVFSTILIQIFIEEIIGTSEKFKLSQNDNQNSNSTDNHNQNSNSTHNHSQNSKLLTTAAEINTRFHKYGQNLNLIHGRKQNSYSI